MNPQIIRVLNNIKSELKDIRYFLDEDFAGLGLEEYYDPLENLEKATRKASRYYMQMLKDYMDRPEPTEAELFEAWQRIVGTRSLPSTPEQDS